MVKHRYTVKVHALILPALINGDYTGIDDYHCKLIKDWETRLIDTIAYDTGKRPTHIIYKVRDEVPDLATCTIHKLLANCLLVDILSD